MLIEKWEPDVIVKERNFELILNCIVYKALQIYL